MRRKQTRVRGGKADEAQGGPSRRCIVSGEVARKETMLRFVIGPDDRVVPDMGGRLPGRGIWLRSKRDMVDSARIKNLFAKAARRRVSVPDDLTEVVEGLLARRCLDLIGLARRAGQSVAGFEKVCTWMRADKGGVLLEAADASPDGRAKVGRLAAGMPLLDLFDGAELGAVVGRPRAVHVVVAPGRLADRLAHEAGRLAGFRESARQGDAVSRQRR